MKLSDIEVFEDIEECKTCKGSCCKNAAGIFHPEQFKNEQEIIEGLRNGSYALDYHEGVKPKYYLRPAHKNAKGKLIDASWGGECVMLSDTGCMLNFEHRPIECQVVKPVSSENCIGINNSKYVLGTEWDKSEFNLYEMVQSI